MFYYHFYREEQYDSLKKSNQSFSTDLKSHSLRHGKLNRTESLWKRNFKKSRVDLSDVVRKSASILYNHKNRIDISQGGNDNDIYRRSFYGLFQADKY